MLRITRVSNGRGFTLRLQGSLREPWVREVTKECSNDPSSVTLDLTGVTFADAEGTRLLCDLLRRGFAVSACSPFVAQLINLENPS